MQESDRETRERIIVEIQRAFEGVRRGNGITLHQARVLDDYGDEVEQAAARRKDTKRRWQDIPDAWIEKLADTLPFLDPEGFRYYIPAFMIYALKHPHSDCPADIAVECNLTLASDSDEYGMARFRLLTETQSKAAARFLEYLARVEQDMGIKTAQEALDSYWFRFL